MKEAAIQTPILRLRQFVAWAKNEGLCKSERDFERQCGLANRYVANCSRSGRGDMGTDVLTRIIRRYPSLNLAWLCTGEGPTLITKTETNTDYRDAYLAAMSHIEALNKLIHKK